MALLKSLGAWGRNRRADGLVEMLHKATDPRAMLAAYHRIVDDRVVEGLMSLSYLALKQLDFGRARSWAQLATDASLIGGSRVSLAEALGWQVVVALDEHDASPDESPMPPSMLETAERVRLLGAESGLPESVAGADGLLARVHDAMGQALPALAHQIESALARLGLPDDDICSSALGRVTGFYWSLEESDRDEGAALLAGYGGRFQTAVTRRWPSTPPEEVADLYDAMSDAASTSGGGDDAYVWGVKSVDLYHGNPERQFYIRGRLQDHAGRVVDLERAREYGEACLAVAPATTSPYELASRHHLLASTYAMLDRLADAIPHYHQAARLYDDDHSGAGTPCLLEAAVFEAKHGYREEARQDLERVLGSSGTAHDFWLAHITLAQLCYNEHSDLATAVVQAEEGLRFAVANLSRPTIWAYALWVAGIVQFAAGNFDKSHRRFALLMELLETHPKPTVIHISPLFEHPIHPPQVILAAQWAHRASAAAGQESDAAKYFALHRQLALADPVGFTLPDDWAYLADDPQVMAVSDLVGTVIHAAQLAQTEPARAMTYLDRARQLATEDADPELIIVMDITMGLCVAALADAAGARTYLDRAVALAADRHATAAEFEARLVASRIAIGEESYEDAYQHLTQCVELIELQRTSLPRAEARMRFLDQNKIVTYLLLIDVCLRLGRATQALETVQLIKSRTLRDLLAQPVRRPIDYELGERAEHLDLTQEDWMVEFLKRPVTDWESEEYLNHLHRTIIHREQIEVMHAQLLERGLMDTLEDEEQPVDFATLVALLRP